ncbi:MAG: hypothetical protein HYZ74_00030 [Elusimicrobia bacterium]|nr:hypothetical protein [Elusimicrobiota bacterium]
MTAAKQGDPKSEIFDGPTPAIPSVEVPALPETTRPGRHVYFPERELEDEIGVGVNN